MSPAPGFLSVCCFVWKDNKVSTEPLVASTYVYLRLRGKKPNSVSFMHDLDADVGVSGQESGLKLYILPRHRDFTPTLRVKSPHAQRPGREYLSNVQTPLWSSDRHSYCRNAVRSRWWYKTGSKVSSNLMQQVKKSTGCLQISSYSHPWDVDHAGKGVCLQGC